MNIFFIVILLIYFAFGKDIGLKLREQNEYVLHQKPNPDMKIGTIKLFAKLKKVNINKVQETIGTDWPLGVVTYFLDTNSYDKIIGERLRSVMSILEGASCIQFNRVIEKPDNMTYILISNPKRERECNHEAKRNEYGEIALVLGYDCLRQHEILHSLLHSIGLNDEVTHPERDRYIRVQWNNIRPEYRKLYRIQARDAFKTLVEYDPMSIMHFHDRAFTSNGQATIVPLLSGLMIRPSEDMSQLDKMKVRLLFEHECNKRKVDDILDSCKNAFHSNGANDYVSDNDEANDASQESDGNEALKDSAGDGDKPDDGDKNTGNEKENAHQNVKLDNEETDERSAGNNDNVEEKAAKNDSEGDDAENNPEDDADNIKPAEDNADNNDGENEERKESEENRIEYKGEIKKRNFH